MKKLKDRVIDKIFKKNIDSDVEYHAGGFFVRKKVEYLFFIDKNPASASVPLVTARVRR